MKPCANPIRLVCSSVFRMGSRRDGKGKSAAWTRNDKEMADKILQPNGLRRVGIDFFVTTPRQCFGIASSFHELDRVARPVNHAVGFDNRLTIERGLCIDA